ncbi:MAG: DUF4129 domain-containing protein [Dermatophilaceae bacterium]
MSAQTGRDRPRSALVPALARAAALLVVAVILILGLIVATGGVVHVVGAPYRDLAIPIPTPKPRRVPGPPPDGRIPTDSAPASLRLLVLALVVATLIAAVVLLWRAWVWRIRRPGFVPVPTPGVAETVLADAPAQIAALRAGTPSNAIIACWQRLETAIDRAGRPAYAWETPTEVTEAVLREFDVDRDCLADLLALYREARFSRHPLGEAERDRALAALDRLHAGLARHTTEAAPDAHDTRTEAART